MMVGLKSEVHGFKENLVPKAEVRPKCFILRLRQKLDDDAGSLSVSHL